MNPKRRMTQKFQPVAVKIGTNKALIALREGIALSLPLVLIGSFLLIVATFPLAGWLNWLQTSGWSVYLNKGINGTYGLMGIVSCFGIATRYASLLKEDGLIAGVLAFAAYVILTPALFATNNAQTASFPYTSFGSQGLFSAILIGLFTARFLHFCKKRHWVVRSPLPVSPAVAKSIQAVIPGSLLLCFWLGIYALLQQLNGTQGSLHLLLKHWIGGPLHLISDTLFGTLVIVGLNSLFWFVGLHGGNVVNSLLQPLWLQNTDENRLLFQAQSHANLPHIITQPFLDQFVFIGGSGATFGLVLIMALFSLRKTSSELTRTLVPITLRPSFFQINEPLLFGLPVVLNLHLLLPFLLAPLMNATVSYLAMSSGLVAKTIGAVLPWTTPPLLSGYLATGGQLSGLLLQLVCIALDVALYWPFYYRLHQQQKKEDLLTNQSS